MRSLVAFYRTATNQSMASEEFNVQFWGVRGSLPCPGVDYAGVGGNTPCLEVRCGGHVMVFDAGSGIRGLGQQLCAAACDRLDLFFTHCHYDHICGLPFFSPLYCPGTEIKMWSGHHLDDMTTEHMVRRFMAAPFFPVGPEVFRANVAYQDFSAGEELKPNGSISVQTTALNHPNGCIGYRIEYGGKTICYVSDTEHEIGKTDRAVCDLIQNADIVIYDAAYTADEYEGFRGFGHSTWQEGARLCDLAGVGQYVTFHHCPSHEDGFMDDLEQQLADERPGSLIAREGLILHP